MTLDEAIIHADEVAESKQKQVNDGVWGKGSITEKRCIACAEEHRQLAEWLKDYKQLLEQQPCEDCISRQAVLNLINADWKYEGLEEDVSSLPPVTPQPKIGHWILTSDDDYEYCTCSECGYQNGENWMIGSQIKYCQECGIRMVEPQKKEGQE